jgi:hypothetical protein
LLNGCLQQQQINVCSPAYFFVNLTSTKESLQQRKTPLSSAAGYVVMVVIPIIFIDKLNATM